MVGNVAVMVSKVPQPGFDLREQLLAEFGGELRGH
jgi:hypothetical protein